MKRIIEIAQEFRAMAQTGLCYDADDYQRERYSRMLVLSDEMLGLASGLSVDVVGSSFNLLKEYATPKLDVRGVVFNDRREILLSQEKCDGCWSLPGGWTDVGLTPAECVVKEVLEETGLAVTPVRMLMLLDYRKWNYPPSNLPIYKLFLLCRASFADMDAYKGHSAFDILDSAFFAQDRIPPLSTGRTSLTQLERLFEYYDSPGKECVID
ncbi:MAG: NUDIX hydrolase N-terminal domain-containing protein [Bacteroidaceae bacterium]|nr:NUDIX hydrolase N-terminal domain-containing protein [Bacteroidaceae bacterium]